MADKKDGQYPMRPKELGKWEGFKQFLYNSETSEFLGRTGGSWGKLQKQKKSSIWDALLESLRKVT